MPPAPPAPMSHRKLGTQGLTVSTLGLGCMGMSQSYGPADEDESVATLRRALELGVTFFDTANAYGLGHNEKLVGRILADHRDDVVVATKFGIAGRRDGRMLVNGRPDYAKACCEESLQRLGMDTIDLYYLHRVDQTRSDRGNGRRHGRAGRSREGPLPRDCRRRRPPPSAGPTPSTRSVPFRASGRCSTGSRRKRSSPPCGSSASGSCRSARSAAASSPASSPRPTTSVPTTCAAAIPVSRERTSPRNLQLVGRVTGMAADKGCTPGQLALAWLVAQGDDVSPIPGTKRHRYLEENVGALEVTLAPDDLSRIDELLPIGAASGPRYEDMSPSTSRAETPAPPYWTRRRTWTGTTPTSETTGATASWRPPATIPGRLFHPHPSRRRPGRM